MGPDAARRAACAEKGSFMFSFLRRSRSTSFVATAAMASATPEPTAPLVRQPADRAAHLDDQRLVFWNAEASRISAAQLSEAAATWHKAVAKQPALPTPELPRLARA